MAVPAGGEPLVHALSYAFPANVFPRRSVTRSWREMAMKIRRACAQRADETGQSAAQNPVQSAPGSAATADHVSGLIVRPRRAPRRRWLTHGCCSDNSTNHSDQVPSVINLHATAAPRQRIVGGESCEFFKI